MSTLLARTTLAPGATTTVATDGSSNIVVHVHKGQTTCEAIIDGGSADGYKFKLENSIIVVTSAFSIIIEGRGKDGAEVEVYTA